MFFSEFQTILHDFELKISVSSIFKNRAKSYKILKNRLYFTTHDFVQFCTISDAFISVIVYTISMPLVYMISM